MRQGSRVAPIFVLSDFRSGSTLLRYILDSHPEICCPAEMAMGTLCQYAFQGVELTARRGEATNAADRDLQLRQVADLVSGVMEKYCAHKNKRRWCEKTPSNLGLIHLLNAVFPAAQYVCLYRCGLDQSSSLLDYEGASRVQPYVRRNGGDVAAAALDRWCEVAEHLLAVEHPG
jgi:hypothetical protein